MKLCRVPISDLRPSSDAPRSGVNPSSVKDLSRSIEAHGLLSPLVATPDGEVVLGQRRLEAARQAGLDCVPVLEREFWGPKAKLLAALTDNLEHQRLDPIDEAKAIDRLHRDLGVSLDEIGEQLGKSRRWILARLQLLGLGVGARQAVRTGKVAPSIGSLAARIQEPARQAAFVNQVAHGSNGSPVPYRQAEQLLRRDYTGTLGAKPIEPLPPPLELATTALQEIYDAARSQSRGLAWVEERARRALEEIEGLVRAGDSITGNGGPS